MSKNNDVIHRVRQYLKSNSKEEVDDEPEEPRPQECCGQSCKPCVFDIYLNDLTKWATNCEEKIWGKKISTSSSEPTGILEKYTSFKLIEITKLTKSTNLYNFECENPIGFIPSGCHLRARILVNVFNIIQNNFLGFK